MTGEHTGPALTLGQVGAPHGIAGWLLVRSFTDPPDSLLDHEEWQLSAPNGATRTIRLLEGVPYRNGLRVRFEGITDRTAAQALTGWWVRIARENLPPLAEGEHYRDDLVGFTVRNVEQVELGRVDYFADLPAGAVMVVKGEREHWLPVSKQYLLHIDAGQRLIEVDWPAEL
ncbi:MAG TPA: ribosome maturation factor RimM [Steroidobacteraceae bacterium]|nr:ribosome maturation factor RimM [Steroidobacteraceae bacterium]